LVLVGVLVLVGGHSVDRDDDDLAGIFRLRDCGGDDEEQQEREGDACSAFVKDHGAN
jgi:hypothetical protein